MWKLPILALLAGVLHGAVIRGVVLENMTGKPLAHTSVILRPIAGTDAQSITIRTNRSGGFDFPPLPPGGYLITASRPGFMPWKYGQKTWRSAGIPILLDEAAATFLDIRLRRYGAITGTVVDDTDVGLPDHEVIAYRNTKPPQIAGPRAKTDDRGAYRLYGLDPGSYLVRTVGKHYEEGDYLPTFSRESESVEQARIAEVALEEQTVNVDVKPHIGKLFSISGRAFVPFDPEDPAPPPVTIVLASEMGRETQTVSGDGGAFQFTQLAPGEFELSAQAPSGRCGRNPVCSAYQRIKVERDETLTLNLIGIPSLGVRFTSTGNQIQDQRSLRVMVRRKDLAGEGEAEELKIRQNSANLGFGRWELMMVPNPSFAVTGFSGPRGERSKRPDGWNEILITGSYSSVQFMLSRTPSELHGVLTNAAHQPVAGAPVFLEAYDPQTRTRLVEPRVVLTDLRGNYQFTGLSPGTYRILGTFEYETADSAAMENGRTVELSNTQQRQFDLDLYEIH